MIGLTGAEEITMIRRCFDIIPERDRRTNRRTDGQLLYQ